MPRYKIIANPTSGRGAGGVEIPHAERLLGSLGVTFDLVRTERRMHAVALAREAVREGYAERTEQPLGVRNFDAALTPAGRRIGDDFVS